MKSLVQRILQKVLGFRNYLFIFSIFKIKTLKKDKGEKDFFHFLDLLNENETVLDIGANIGIMTSHLAKKANKGHLHAFEPVPDNIAALERIIRYFKLKNVQLHKIALGNEKGEIEMVMPEIDAVKKQGLSHVIHDDITEFNEGHRFSVPLEVIDELNLDQDSRVQAIKIDVENFEYYVFLGAEKLINKNQPYIYCELWDNENRYRCFELMRKWNYEIMVLNENHLVPFDKSKHSTQNFFFVPAIN